MMNLALQQAVRALRISSPNPRVGCVIVAADGRLLGQGHTQAVGGPHAEIMALRDADAAGNSVLGATAFVTLEPCAHHGRTGPCCDALVAAGIAKVVAAIQDPNPLVAGQGFARLQGAGVAVEVGEGAAAARELNLGFFSRMVRGVPWVRLKAATSLDGRTALPNGVSQWITSDAARRDGHAWRARACAILTGVGTVLGDNPRLDVRLGDVQRQPALVIVDSHLQTPPDAALWGAARRRVLVYTAAGDAARHDALQALGAEIVVLPDTQGKVDLAAMMRDLGRRDINELHVEAGHKLNGSLIRACLVDELLLYQAPMLLGDGVGLAALGPFSELAQAPLLHVRDIQTVGPDMRLIARWPGRDDF